MEVVWSSKEEDPPLYSILETKPFAKVWKSWKPRRLELRRDGSLLVYKGSEFKAKIDVSRISITLIRIETRYTMPESIEKFEMGIHVVCLAAGKDNQVEWRCILQEAELDASTSSFLGQLRMVAIEHNIDSLRQEAFRAVSTNVTMQSLQNHSVMRRAVAKAMDKFETRSRQQQILARRGVMKSLPVLFDNDLIHGSWWFSVGSLYVVVAASIVLANGFDNKFLGDDSSGMTNFHYRATWVLILISGLFFTGGSLAFVRAVHEPALKPCFPNWYHFQSDELLGSWLFFLGVVPLLPYCFIFLVESTSFNEKMMFLGCMAISVLLLIASFLFARACYPSEHSRQQYILPLALCCLRGCLAEKWISFHFANDWLAGCWLLFWATVLCTLACFVLMISAIQTHDSLLTFIYTTAWTENIMFSIGAAYFVCGSYPERRGIDEGEDVEDPSYRLVDSTHICIPGRPSLSSAPLSGHADAS